MENNTSPSGSQSPASAQASVPIHESAPAAGQEQPPWQVRKTLGSIFRDWRERRQAARICGRLLNLYRKATAAQPSLPKRALYRQVVMDDLRCSVSAADEILRGAEQSYAIWPVERDLRLQDVVHYVVVKEYLMADQSPTGRAPEDIAQVIASRIPFDL